MANFTANEIKKSFVKLLNTKPYNKITVKDIVEDCGINRNSFYYHFADIPALVEAIFVDENQRLMNKHTTIDSLDAFIDDIAEVCLENKNAILNLFYSSNRAIYEEYAMRISEDAITKYFAQTFKDVKVDEKDRNVAIQTSKCMLFGVSIDWVYNDLSEEYVERLHDMIKLLHGISNIVLNRIRVD